jgi:RimJ/RimL family protein N-acetyltransferase
MADVLSLRNFTTDDLDHFLEWATDPEVTKFLTWEPYTSRDEALAFLTSVAIPHPWLKAICLDGKAIGSINLRKGSGVHRCLAVMGYCLSRKYWGRGYVTQAVKLALSTGFQDLDVVRIEALVNPKNIGSRRVLEKAGFQQDDLLKSCMVVSIGGQERICDALLFSTCLASL